jgi:uroporphyrinogen III methyltransferase / synthase
MPARKAAACTPSPRKASTRLLVKHAKQGKMVVRLKGGDPFIFGRGAEEIEELVGEGIDFEVVPGVTSATAAATYAGIPITHREYTASVAFVTGHEDPTKKFSNISWEKLATGVGTIVIYMGIKTLPSITRKLIDSAARRKPRLPWSAGPRLRSSARWSAPWKASAKWCGRPTSNRRPW